MTPLQAADELCEAAEQAAQSLDIKWLEDAVAAYRAARDAEAWLPIEEDAPIDVPLDTNVLLGWWEDWPELKWRVEYGWAGSERGGWRHGRATHWIPNSFLPPPPGAPK